MTHRRTLMVLASVSLMALGAGTMDAATTKKPATRHTRPTSRHAPAAKAPVTAPAAPSGTGVEASRASAESVNVHAELQTATGVTGSTPGGGLMPEQTAPKSRSGLTRDFIAKQSPTSNPTNMIASLPGVVTGSGDPLGTSDQQVSLSVRGLTQFELGYTYEGIPAADPLNFFIFTGTTADNENIQAINLAQGSADISAPLYNAVGGQLSETLRDPAAHFGGLVNLAYGSYALNREFIRIDSGEIGHTGIRSFASFSYEGADNWRGPGRGTRYHVDAKAVKEWGDGNRASFVLSYNSPTGYYLKTPTLAQWKSLGTKANYAYTYRNGGSSYYRFDENQRNSLILGAPAHFRLADNLTADVTPYFTYFWGYGNGGTTLSTQGSYVGDQNTGPLVTSSSASTIVAAAIDTFHERHSGLNSAIHWTTKHNTLTLGYWYSYYTQQEHSYYAEADDQGHIASMIGDYPIYTSAGIPLSRYNINFVQQTNAIYINDVFKAFNDRLTIEAGFKEAMVSRMSTQLVPGANYKTTVNYAEPLPQFAMSYKITPHDQIYINGSTAFRAPSSILTMADYFSTSTGKIAHSRATNLSPEYSIGEEIGFRHYGLVNISAALFNYNLTNRQLSSTVYMSGVATTASINAGGQTSRGAELEIGLRPWRHFSPYLSGQYLHATIDNNLSVGTDLLPTKGKTAVNTPAFSGAIGLSYDDGALFGNFSLNYVGSQYATFMNDQKIPSYITGAVTMGYRFRSLGFVKHPQIQLNLINLGNSGYLSGASSLVGNAKATRGVYGTSIAAQTPLYYVGGGFAGVVSVTAGF
ncbi:TonB-dependent receptor [Acetobacter nitrogenifigens DSM 23921 = NBRC 105050]|uniref:TonB-dependent receptor n=1 Tax=Acetobacter nitrogenifigens DSM 23921 = NBRC 105050 TaxID=1120919 RepID=A0A511X5M2_9PROT|nr:TonB-dependent receptor [Acetobacter nitrogenifigens]GBQ98304.1 TonB-dependent receptor [Acetobacter nitrogenifigens DSM 23921 = NBRC 105050]GEN58233.1 TonB-dependent receptor [Acetobacter nitrogenifigens DSM 23921 = NBRC 105050]